MRTTFFGPKMTPDHAPLLPTQPSGDAERNQHYAAARPCVRLVDHLYHHHTTVGAGTGVEAAPGRQTGPAIAEGGFSDGGNQRARLLCVRWPPLDSGPGATTIGQRFPGQSEPGGLH